MDGDHWRVGRTVPVMTETIRIGQPPQGPPRRERRSRWPLLAGGLAVLVMLAAGAAVAGIAMARRDARASATATPSSTLGQTMNVRGAVKLRVGQYFAAGNSCAGDGGYRDLAPGAQVTVTDETGKILAVGRITTGAGSATSGCTLLFEVDNVPRGAAFYGVEVSHRGRIQKTEAAILAGPLEFTIG